MKRPGSPTFAFLTVAGFLAAAGLAQTQPPIHPPVTLQITAPASGIAVHPGDQIAVAVTAPYAHALGVNAVNQVMLVADGIGFSSPQMAPYRFTFLIPADTQPGEHQLVAVGLGGGNMAGVSAPLLIEVERLDWPVRMVAEPGSLVLRTLPGTSPSASAQTLRLYYEYADGSRVLVPQNAVSFAAAQGYVTVDAAGQVTPKAPNEPVSDRIVITCLACQGVAPPAPIVVMVQTLPINITEKSISIGPQGGPVQITAVTGGMVYQAVGEPWMTEIVSQMQTINHWTTMLEIAANPSKEPRVGSLRFTMSNGDYQDVVVYQGGGN